MNDDRDRPSPPPAGRTLYGRRRGKKLRPAQAGLLEAALPGLRVTLPPEGQALDPAALVPGARELWLEVGFGAGEHLLWQATHNPDVGLIGCEPFVNGMARATAAIARGGIANVRLFGDDARLLLRALPDACLARVFVLFPDPWPKARHHKRRFVATPTLDLLTAKMRDGAELRLATDDASYLPWMVEHACRHPDLDWLAERPADWRRRPEDWPPTRYEEKAIAAGRSPAFLRLRRVPRHASTA